MERDRETVCLKSEREFKSEDIFTVLKAREKPFVNVFELLDTFFRLKLIDRFI